ncbi:MAG: hypothetical protein QOJ99_362 [Bryobacterales bacterium]|nr:hypothetical protein [Bryobacterales bacterium]
MKPCQCQICGGIPGIEVFRYAEIEQLDTAVRLNQNVRRFKISVDDSPAVGEPDCVAH